MKTRHLEAIKTIIRAIGDDPGRNGLLDTPERVVRSWEQLFSGYKADPAELMRTFEDSCDEMVILRGVEFTSCCEHHLLPFIGTAHIAYIPDGRVIGISKLARLVEVYSRRLQIQERICQQVTQALDKYLKPKGSACILEAKHLCMVCRGVQKQNATMITSSLTGSFRDEPETRAELFSMLRR